MNNLFPRSYKKMFNISFKYIKCGTAVIVAYDCRISCGYIKKTLTTPIIYVRSYEVMIARASRASGVPDWINQNLSDFSKDGLRRSKRFKGQRLVSGLFSHLVSELCLPP